MNETIGTDGDLPPEMRPAASLQDATMEAVQKLLPPGVTAVVLLAHREPGAQDVTLSISTTDEGDAREMLARAALYMPGVIETLREIVRAGPTPARVERETRGTG